MLVHRARIGVAWLLGGLLPLWAATPASACSTAIAPVFVVDPALGASDTTAPSPFTNLSATSWRETGTNCSGFSCSSSSCGDRAGIDLTFTPPSDGESPANRLGYRLVWLHGDMPDGLSQVIRQPQSLPSGGALSLRIGFDSARRMNGEFALIALDAAGNESELSAPVHVEFSGCTRYFDDHDSCTEPSCGALPGLGGPARAANGGWLVLLLMAALVVRSRSRRSAKMH